VTDVHPLTGERLLEAWDRGAAQHDLDRALTMLAVARPGTARGALAALSVPERNRHLLRLRQVSFGSELRGYVPCASCGTRLEFSMSIPPLVAHLERLEPGGPVRWTRGARTFSMRPVTSEDLLAVVRAPDAPTARRVLLARCLSATDAGGGVACADPIDDAEALMLEQFDRLHEGAEIVCELRCPACASVARVDLDIGRFLWSEVRHAAAGLLREVHELAAAYGWTEAAILAMSDRRRRTYLEMVRA